MIKLAVLMGGRSSEHEVSLATGAAMLRHLHPARYRAKPVRIDRDGRWRLADGYPGLAGLSQLDALPPLRPGAGLAALEREHVELVLIALHGPGGEDGAMQGALDTLGLPYTGAGVASSAMAMDKRLTRRLLAEAGVPVAPAVELSRDDSAARAGGIGFPVVAKVPTLGSSTGMGLARDARELETLARSLFAAHPGCGRLLVERYVEGRELTCGVLADATGQPVPLPATEIRRPGPLFDYHAKYTAGACEELTPAPLDAVTSARVAELALRCHRLLDAGPLSRTDMILDPHGGLWVLELNTLPGMTPTSLVPQAAAVAGLGMPVVLDRLIAFALARHSAPILASA